MSDSEAEMHVRKSFRSRKPPPPKEVRRIRNTVSFTYLLWY